MKKKIIISAVTVLVLILLSILFVNSYTQALSKEEKLQIKKEIIEQEVKNDRINEEEAKQLYTNIEQRITSCNNYGQNEYCQINQQNNCVNQENCINQNNYVNQNNDHCRRNNTKGICNR